MTTWRMCPAIFALALAAFGQPSPNIRVSVQLVSVPALVLSKENRLVPNLQNSDFIVTDNGKPQTFTVGEMGDSPFSIALAIQTSGDIRTYANFISKVGSAVDALLVGTSGEAAVLTYGDEVSLVKPFESGDIQAAVRTISAGGRHARMLDAGVRGIHLLAQRSTAHSRVLLLVGQPYDFGSESDLASLQQQADREHVVIYALALPELGTEFVSDTFSLQGLSSRTQRGGFRVDIDLGRLIPILGRSAKVEVRTDPFSVLTSSTGGAQLHFRTQRQLEDGLRIIGLEMRSTYVLSYYPTTTAAGYHHVKVEVDSVGAKIFARPGYWHM